MNSNVGWLLLAMAAVGLSAAAAALRAFPRRLTECAAGLLVVAISEVVVAMLLAGAVVRDLSTVAVVLVTVIVATIVTAVAVVGIGPRELISRARDHVRALTDGARRLAAYPWTLILTLFAGVEVAWALITGFFTPPYAYDALTYHLPSVAYWIQQNQIGPTPYAIWSNVYPMNAELTMAWPAAILRSDVLLNLGQFPFAVMGATALVIIGRAIGLRRPTALAVACLFLLTPLVLAQVSTPYVDLALASELLTAFAFLLRAVQTLAARTDDSPFVYFLFAGLATGLAVGSKSSALAAGAVFVLVVTVAVVRGVRTRTIGTRQVIAIAGIVLVPILALGSYWYVRDWVEYGNPVYPITVQVGGIELFPGRGSVADTVLQKSAPPAFRNDPWPLQVLRSWATERPGRSYTFDARFGGYGPIWPLLALPALAAFAWWCLRRRRDLLYWVVVPFTAVFLLQPARWWTRFTIMFLGLGLLALGWAVDQLRGRTSGRVLQGAIVVTVAVVLLPAAAPLRFLSRDPSAVAASIGEPRSSLTIGIVVNRDFRWVDDIPRHSTIGTRVKSVPKGWVYALMGQNFTNRVQILDGHDQQAVAEQIKQGHIDYVVTGRHDALERMMRTMPSAHLLTTTKNSRVFRT
jgi:hypothetical protein